MESVSENTLEQRTSKSPGRDIKCCIICLGELEEQCEAQPCKHNNFDCLCLITWLRERPTCPLCQRRVHEVRYDLSGDGKRAKTCNIAEWFAKTRQSTGHTGEGLGGSGPNSILINTRNPSRSREIQQLYEEEAIERRRFIYRHKLYSLHVGSNSRQPAATKYKELSPQLFMSDPELLSRAREWLGRELQVFGFLHATDGSLEHGTLTPGRRVRKAEFLLEYVIAILKVIDLHGSGGQAEDLIQEFLGRENTRLFLHELRAWLRSPYKSLAGWDRVVQYNANAFPRGSQDAEGEPAGPRPINSEDNHMRLSKTGQRTAYRYQPYKHRLFSITG